MKRPVKLDRAHVLINHGPCCLITTHDGKNPNIMTIAWSTPVNSVPPLVAVVIGEQAYSLKSIKKNGEFGINVPSKKLKKEVEYCGSATGKKVDKFKVAGLTQYPASKIKPPLVKECIAHLECRLHKKYKFGDAYLIVARVLAASVDTGLFDDHLKVDKLEAKTLHHLGGRFFTTPAGILAGEGSK